MGKNDIRALTGIRGAAELLIVIYHYLARSAALGPAASFVRHCYVMTDIFFVLSGFVLALTYQRHFASGTTIRVYVSFLYKRLGRIYPMLFVASALMVVLTLRHPADGPPLTFGVFLANATLTNAWGIVRSFVGPGWSVSTEFGAYLAFPLFVACTLRGRRWTALLATALSVACVAIVATRSNAALHQTAIGWRFGPLDVFDAHTLYPGFRSLADFNLGVLAFRLTGYDRVRRIAGSRAVGDGLTFAMLLLLCGPRLPVVDVAFVLCIPCFLVTLALGRSGTARLLALPLVHDFGLLSYSIYLLHEPLLLGLEERIGHAFDALGLGGSRSLVRVALLPVVTVAAIVTYNLVEKPARDWSRRLVKRRTIRLRQSAAVT